MSSLKLALTLSASLVVSACATLNESECVNADWKIIGLEDGSKGRTTAYIGNHRKACAEHGVTPNLDRYQAGYQQGLRRFCTPESGFAQGKRGRKFDGVCPADLRSDFLYGYERGRELYLLKREIDQINRQVVSTESELTAISSRINELELKLISKAGSAEQRLAMLQELKQLQTTLAIMQNEIHHLELDAAKLQGEYNVLDAEYNF